MMKKSIALFMLPLAVGFASCSDKDLYDENYEESQAKSEFRAKFVQKYGDVAKNQNWDLTHNATQYASLATRAGEVVSAGKEETFSADLRKQLANVLDEGTDNHRIGSAYTLISQGPFDIYPLYHGQCMQWDLYVNDIKIADYAGIMKMMGEKTDYRKGNTTSLTAKGWHIDLPVGTPIFIKLVVTKNQTGWFTSDGQYAENGDVITSVYYPAVPYKSGTISNGSLILPWDKLTTKPDNLDHIIMFEDAKTESGDADFNDFVIGIKGRDITPDPIDVIVTEDETTYTVPSSTEKRYMIEDLGSVDDFDFNDVVVDVTEKKTEIHTVKTITKEKSQGGSVIAQEESIKDTVTRVEVVQSASIKHLGGTLPFKLQIGATALPEIQGELDKNPEGLNYTITGWNPAENNIKVVVRNVNNDGVKTVSFPKIGEVPMIIATDKNVEWMSERVAIPERWWKEGDFTNK